MPLHGIDRVDIDAQQTGLTEQGMRASGEVLQATADRNHQIGLRCHGIRGRRTGDANRAQLQTMRPGQGALAGLGLGDRDAMLLGEALQRCSGITVQHAATGNDQRLAGVSQQGQCLLQLFVRWRLGPQHDGLGSKEGQRIVKCHGLHILRQGERYRTTLGRIGQHLNRPWQGAQQLLGITDAVKKT